MKTRKNKKKVHAKREVKSKKQIIQGALKKDLSKKLGEIYSSPNLETTMTCQCTCCQVAMPQMNYCEFVQIANTIWNSFSSNDKVELILTSVEYFFKNEFEKWGIDSLVKPCMFLNREDGLCKIYENRPLSCRTFGLWPKKAYENRVEKFADFYSKYGLSKNDLPLFKQCEKVKRVSEENPLTEEDISAIYEKIDHLDSKISDFSKLQIKNKENYRTFHDWLLLKIFGEDWLVMLSNFMIAADKEKIEDALNHLKTALYEKFSKDLSSVKGDF
jgi:Fe-S-cluster containining protein